MNREQALAFVKPYLTEQRYIHTIGVMETAIALAEKYDANPEKAELAAIFHDMAKFRPKEEMKQIILNHGYPVDLLNYNPELWHAPVGEHLARVEAGISDVEVLGAIRYHTSGRPGMTLLEKIIYLADYIEPGRNFPGVEDTRKLAVENLDLAVIEAVRNTIGFLMSRNQTVYPETFLTYNDLIKNRRIDA